MGTSCGFCGKPVKRLTAPFVEGNFYLCDDCYKIFREKVIALEFKVLPKTWEFSADEMLKILSGNGAEVLEMHKQTQAEKQEQKQNRKELSKRAKVCCICGEEDCSGGEFIQEGYRLCERCASNYVMTAAEAEIGTEFFASHSPEFFKEELSECYNPHPNISFNFRTKKIYLKNTLSKKNYKVVGFSDLIGYCAETKEAITADKQLFRTLDADFCYNGTTIHYHIDDSPSMNKHQEFDKVLNCFAHIQNDNADPTQSEKFDPDSSTQNLVKPFQFSCPKCGGTNCVPIVETSTTGHTFSAGKACCGLLFFMNPAGLLCGLCGNGKQVTNTTYWMCPNCGNKFKK